MTYLGDDASFTRIPLQPSSQQSDDFLEGDDRCFRHSQDFVLSRSNMINEPVCAVLYLTTIFERRV